MKIGVSIEPIVPILKDIQEFLEDLFVELENVKNIEIHTNDLDEFVIFLLNLSKKFDLEYSVHCPHAYSKEKVNFCSGKIGDIHNAEKWLRKSIEYSKKIKAKRILIHPDIPVNASKAKALKILEKHIKNNLKFLDKEQNILIENMPSKKCALSTPSEFKSFLKRFNNQVGVCWDVGHEIQRFKNQNFTFPKILKLKIKEVHISGLMKSKNFEDHHPLTEGELNLSNCIKSLKKIKYNGSIILEVLTKNPMDIINSKKELEKFLKN